MPLARGGAFNKANSSRPWLAKGGLLNFYSQNCELVFMLVLLRRLDLRSFNMGTELERKKRKESLFAGAHRQLAVNVGLGSATVGTTPPCRLASSSGTAHEKPLADAVRHCCRWPCLSNPQPLAKIPWVRCVSYSWY